MAITLSGGTTVGNAGPVATIKPVGVTRIQFDIAGTYVTGGYADFQTFVRTILGTKVTMVDAWMTMPGGAFYAYWDQTNDKLKLYVASTGIEVGNGVACDNTNLEMTVIFE